MQPRGMLGAKSGNSVLAAGDGHIRSKTNDEKNMHRTRFDGQFSATAAAAGAGISVSKRARAMGAKAEVERTKATTGASASAQNDKRFGKKSVVSGAGRSAVSACGSGSSETVQQVQQDTALLPKNRGNGDRDSSQRETPGRAQEQNLEEGERERERVAPLGGFSSISRRNGRSGSNSTGGRYRDSSIGGLLLHSKSLPSSSSSSSSGAPATTTSGSSAATTALAGRRCSLAQSSSSRTSLLGKGYDSSRTSSGGVRRPLAGASSSPRSAAISAVRASIAPAASKPRPRASGRAAGTTQSVGAGEARLGLGSTTPDEAGLAAAMASISSAVTTARIVNTVGGAGSSGGRASLPSAIGQDIGPSSLSAISAVSTVARVDGISVSQSVRSDATAEAAEGEGGCGPGLAALPGGSNRRTKCAKDDDWHLRASLAVGRVLEEKEQAAAAAGARGFGMSEMTGGASTAGEANRAVGGGSGCGEKERVVSLDGSSNRHGDAAAEGQENSKSTPGPEGTNRARSSSSHQRHSRRGDDTRESAAAPTAPAAAAWTRVSDSEDEWEVDGAGCSGSDRKNDDNRGRPRSMPRASLSEQGKASEGGSNGSRAKASGVKGAGSQGIGTAPPGEGGGAARIGDRGRGGATSVTTAGRKKKSPKTTEVKAGRVVVVVV